LIKVGVPHLNHAGENDVSVGNNVKIQNGAMLYHGLTVEDGVFIRPQACMTNLVSAGDGLAALRLAMDIRATIRAQWETAGRVASPQARNVAAPALTTVAG